MTIHIGTLSDLKPQVRTIVFIGSRSSDHLRELVRIAEFKGRAAYRIESASELQPRWFAGAEEVGVVLGAADLQGVTKAVLDRLNMFAAAEARGMLEGVTQ
jgi:4-hydroxy-3-methylbut-2-enyl diphosphate reductase